MSDNPENPPKVEENNSATNDATANAESDAGLLSLENLDSIIEQNDPEFQKEISDISPEGGAADLNIDLIDLDKVLAEEESRSLKARTKRLYKRVRNKMAIMVLTTKNYAIAFVQEDLPAFYKFVKGKIARGIEILKNAKQSFMAWPRKQKLAALGIFLAALGVASYIHTAWTTGVIPGRSELFTVTLEVGADSVQSYDPATESEPFYDSSRASQNLMVLPRMVVNLRRSVNSGTNPMGAFEFFVEGNSPDVMVEIKDREYEVRDLFQRNIEEMSFDQMHGSEGKQLLLEKLRREVNKILTKGRVRRIFYKKIIIKP